MTGIGLGLKWDKKGKQTWRMDYHRPHCDPQATDFWDSRPIHYHISVWS